MWPVAALALAAAGDRRGRRGVLRGASTAAAVLVAGGVAGRVSGSPRVSAITRSGAVAAFVSGASLELPLAAGPLTGLAIAEASLRARSTSARRCDLAIGSALGAVASVAALRGWPTPPAGGAEAPPSPRRSPRQLTDDGAAVTIVINPGAGSGDGALREEIEQALPSSVLLEVDDNLMELLDTAAHQSAVIGVVGGDGSINAAAGVAIENDLPLLVFPGGTLNHFARDAGLDSVADTVEALTERNLARVDVGRIDGRPFLNTASFGSYAELVDMREKLEPRLGKWAAMAVAAARIVRNGSPTDLIIDGEQLSIWMIFIGNCVYDPPGLAPGFRRRLDDGLLDVRFVDAGLPWSRTRLVGALLTGQLGRSRVYRRLVIDRLEIESLDGSLRLACDGETFDGGQTVIVDKDPVGLDVYVKM